MRKKIIIGNWKMNLTLAEGQDLVFKLKGFATEKINVDIAVCPSFVYLSNLCPVLKGSKIKIGAQNMYFKEDGAFTGEISPKMLKDLNIDMVIIGHSERRQFFNETDENVNLKIKSALKAGLIPIFCVGEDLKVREEGKAENFVKNQILAGIKDLGESELEKLVIAYEPIWAIGTGKICSGEDANKIIAMIRRLIKENSSEKTSDKVRILYGGSIKSSNFNEHIKFADIDGGLVGGASLTFDEFSKIISLANSVHELHQSHPV